MLKVILLILYCLIGFICVRWAKEYKDGEL